jgi:hypothetical protein
MIRVVIQSGTYVKDLWDLICEAKYEPAADIENTAAEATPAENAESPRGIATTGIAARAKVPAHRAALPATEGRVTMEALLIWYGTF